MTDNSLVNGVDFVVMPTEKFDTACEFYGKTLGLPCSARYGSHPGAEFETGSLTSPSWRPPRSGWSSTGSPNPIALHVDDFDTAKAELESRGVDVQGRHDRLGRVSHGVLRGPGRQRPDDPPPLRAPHSARIGEAALREQARSDLRASMLAHRGLVDRVAPNAPAPPRAGRPASAPPRRAGRPVDPHWPYDGS